jgi:hypothetical protein
MPDLLKMGGVRAIGNATRSICIALACLRRQGEVNEDTIFHLPSNHSAPAII